MAWQIHKSAIMMGEIVAYQKLISQIVNFMNVFVMKMDLSIMTCGRPKRVNTETTETEILV